MTPLHAIADAIVSALEYEPARAWQTWDAFAGKTVHHTETEYERRRRVILAILTAHFQAGEVQP